MKNLKTERKNKIYINIFKKKSFGFDDIKLSNKIIKKVLETEKINYNISLNISIVGINKIRTINKKLRNIDKATDVLSFPNIQFKKPSSLNSLIKNKSVYNSIYDFDTNSFYLGDIIICYDKIISQSKKYNHSIKREFSFLLVHSMLHLLGYDHMNKRDEEYMFDKQDKILELLNILR